MNDSDRSGEIVEALAAGLRATLAGAAPPPWEGPRPAAPAICAIMAADAPAAPETLTGAPPGLLYTLRPVGGLVPPAAGGAADGATGAALEFAIRVLGIGDLILFGHPGAAFVRALVADTTPAVGPLVQGDYLPGLTAMLGPAAMRALGAAVEESQRPRICVQEIMRLTIENLMTYPWLVERVLGGTLRLHGWYVGDGGFERFDPAADEFVADQAPPLIDGK